MRNHGTFGQLLSFMHGITGLDEVVLTKRDEVVLLARQFQGRSR